MRTLLLALLTLVAGWSGGCTSVPSHDQLRGMAVSLRFSDGWCSGTKIGPQLIRSAKHCFSEGSVLRQVSGVPVTVRKVTERGADTVDVSVAGVTFDRWAQIGPTPRQGDHIRWWGTPGGEPDVYREGYVSRAWTNMVVIDATICKGDSGAGIFNDRGQLVGVVSYTTNLNGCTFMVSVPTKKKRR